MKITIESTSRIVELSGVECRVWQGATEGGVKVQVLVPQIAVLASEDKSQFDQFEAELKETPPPCEGPQAFPLRMVI